MPSLSFGAEAEAEAEASRNAITGNPPIYQHFAARSAYTIDGIESYTAEFLESLRARDALIWLRGIYDASLLILFEIQRAQCELKKVIVILS